MRPRSFLIQSVPTSALKKINRAVKRHYGKGNFYRLHPEVEKIALGGKFFGDKWVLCEYGWSVCELK